MFISLEALIIIYRVIKTFLKYSYLCVQVCVCVCGGGGDMTPWLSLISALEEPASLIPACNTLCFLCLYMGKPVRVFLFLDFCVLFYLLCKSCISDYCL